MSKMVYRILFVQEEQIYEVYAHLLSEESLVGFIEVEGIFFRDTSDILKDRLDQIRQEFSCVKRSYIPIQNILRIDAWEEETILNTDNVRPLLQSK